MQSKDEDSQFTEKPPLSAQAPPRPRMGHKTDETTQVMAVEPDTEDFEDTQTASQTTSQVSTSVTTQVTENGTGPSHDSINERRNSRLEPPKKPAQPGIPADMFEDAETEMGEPARDDPSDHLVQGLDEGPTRSSKGGHGTDLTEMLDDEGHPIPTCSLESMPGRRVGVYRLQAQLGRGGMGAVFLAKRVDGELEMTVAVKIMLQKISARDMTGRFRQERQLLANLRHPHIAALLDAGSLEEGLPYFIMEYIEGRTIDRWCIADKPSPVALLELFRKIVLAVGAAHRAGVIHRDIKPGNIMVTDEGEPKLLDFGIAVVSDGDIQEEGFVMMTPDYASPEQRMGSDVGPESDIYALGLLLLELLTGFGPRKWGRPPAEAVDHFFADDPTDQVDPDTDLREKPGAAIDDETLSKLTAKLHDLPELLRFSLKTALAAKPQARYASTDGFAADLARIIKALGSEAVTETREVLHDAVIWYHPESRDAVLEFARHLTGDGGLNVWLDVWRLGPDDAVAGPTAEAVNQAGAVLVCLDSAGQGPWLTDPYLRDTVAGHALRKTIPIFPILLPGAAFPKRQSSLPPFLREMTWTNFQDGYIAETLEQLAIQLHGRPYEISTSALNDAFCPFRGLESFREEDRNVFFGREAVVQRLAAHVREHHFAAVLGPSGSGKSSIVMAGLIPLLRDAGHEVALFTPGTNPIKAIAFALTRLMKTDHQEAEAAHLEDRLRTAPEALYTIIREVSLENGPRPFLVIDQFEELFTLCSNRQERTVVAEALCYAADQADGPAIVFTMRSDFLGSVVEFPDLNNYLSDNFLQVSPMIREELARAIEEPARVGGLTLEPGLLERMLDDLTNAAGELPLLEHALLELFERKRGAFLTLKAYADIGGIEGALARRAEAEFQQLDEHARETLRRMFVLCLVQPGDGVPDTRRRATQAELRAIDPQGEDVNGLIMSWTGARLLTSHHDPIRDTKMVEVAHEALIRKWPRIQEWMAEDREIARMLHRLRRQAETWEQAKRDPDHLPRGGPLARLTSLMEQEGAHMATLEKEFIRAAVNAAEAAEREKTARFHRDRRRTRNAVGAFVILILVFLGIALKQLQQTRAERANAVSQAERARSMERRAVANVAEANYNLGIAFNEKAGIALKEDRPHEAWIHAVAALSREIPVDRGLPEPLGRFMDPRIKAVEQLLWTSPAAPVVSAAAWSPDGSLIALACSDYRMRLVDPRHGGQTAILAGPDVPIRAGAFSCDNRYLAVTDGKLHLWDLAKNEKLKTLWYPSGGINTLTALPNKGFLLGHEDGSISQLYPESDQPVRIIGQINAPIDQIQMSPRGERAAVLTNNSLFLLDLAASRLVPHPATSSKLTTAGFDGRGNLITGHENGAVLLWNKEASEEIVRLETPVEGVSAAPDTSSVLIRSSKGVHLFQMDRPNAAEMISENPSLLAEVSPDGTTLLTTNDRNVPLLVRLADNTPIAESSGHSDEVHDLDVSPDGRILATASHDNTIILWNTSDMSPITTLVGHTGWVIGVAFSPDGGSLVSGAEDGRILIWSLESDTPLKEFKANDKGVQCVDWSPDGLTIAAGYAEGAVRLWDVTTAKPRKSLETGVPILFDIAWSPDGKTLACAGYDRTVRLWNSDLTGERTLVGHPEEVNSIAWSPDGSQLASGGFGGKLIIWDPKTGKQTHLLTQHGGGIQGIDYSRDGRRLVSASMDKTLRIWDADTKKELMVLHGHTRPLHHAVFAADTRTVFSGSVDGTVRRWDILSPPRQAVFSGHEDQIFGAAASPDSRLAATAAYDETIRVWDLTGESEPVLLRGHEADIFNVAFSKDGRRLASVSHDETLRIWDLPTRKNTKTFKGHKSALFGLAWSPDESQIATASFDTTIGLWDLSGQTQPRFLQGHDNAVVSVVWFPDGKRLASCSFDRTIKIWDAETGEVIRTLKGHLADVIGLDLSPDGKTLASCSYDRTVRLWDPETGELLRTLTAHDAEVFGLVFTPNGDRLISAGYDNTARVWDWANGKQLAVLKGHEAPINFIDVTPDGTTLITPSADLTVRLWNLSEYNNLPDGATEYEWYGALLKRGLQHYGYLMIDFRILPAAAARLRPMNGYRFQETDPNAQLATPRTPDTPYVDWLMRGYQP